MNKLAKNAALASSLALLCLPASALAGPGKSDQPHGKAGHHGNHCGRGHVKHVKGQGGLKIGKGCVKVTRPSDTPQPPTSGAPAPGKSGNAHDHVSTPDPADHGAR